MNSDMMSVRRNEEEIRIGGTYVELSSLEIRQAVKLRESCRCGFTA